MKCKRCGNEDPAYFYKGSRGYYCRKCVRFKRILLSEDLEPFQDYDIEKQAYAYSFSYTLTFFQQRASHECTNALKNKDVLLNCVTGAGKTEIVVESISNYLKQGKKVCYAISRREVVLELHRRFQTIFLNAKVVAVYGGHHKELSGDLLVCTTHQLFRYYHSFDLLILDEVDAFPLKGNVPLLNICLNASRGRIIYSSATFDETFLKQIAHRPYQEVSLNIRPSGKPLVEPKVIYSIPIFCLLMLLIILKKSKRQAIIFVSSKRECESYYFLFHFFLSCTYVYSDLNDRDQNIKAFKEKKYQFIFATTVLERGITIEDIDVIILYFQKGIFDKASLIQMLGRVGRGIRSTEGKSYILSSVLSKDIEETQSYLRKVNHEVSLL